MTDARVVLWGREIGAVSWLDDREIGIFQYTPEFAGSGIEAAPMMMPLRAAPYEFPALPRETFKGLPGLLADSLPDRFGNALIDAWLAAQGRAPASFNPVERLCYVGPRGMGALEFEPAIKSAPTAARKVEVAALVELANRVLDDRIALGGKFAGIDDKAAIEDILRVGTSAGGARAKAVLAWNEATGEFRSGQLKANAGFTYWLIKFDGVAGNRDKELTDGEGFGRIEYAYYLMAREAGIEMMDSRLYREGGRAHFMTKRFDRTDAGDKLHMQSLCAMMHFDFNNPAAYSYEQALQAIARLGLPAVDREQQFHRAVFNVLARNHDDHVKNIAFLMDRQGAWRLAPAFDVAYSYNPAGAWTSRHQMSLNGKRDNFLREDLIVLGAAANLKKAKASRIIDEIGSAIQNWGLHAEAASLPARESDRIAQMFRGELV